MRQRRRHNRTARGAALVLALLVMLVLSGLALVAMHATTTSNVLSGMHRMTSQTKSMSNAANELGLLRSGRQASQYHAALQDQFDATDRDAARRGGFLLFSTNPTSSEAVELDTGGSFLDRPGTYEAVESDPAYDTEYRFIVRDSTLGPRAEGFGDEFCFIRVTVGSDALLQGTDYDEDADAEERARQARAMGRNVSQAMIGPIECG